MQTSVHLADRTFFSLSGCKQEKGAVNPKAQIMKERGFRRKNQRNLFFKTIKIHSHITSVKTSKILLGKKT